MSIKLKIGLLGSVSILSLFFLFASSALVMAQFVGQKDVDTAKQLASMPAQVLLALVALLSVASMVWMFGRFVAIVQTHDTAMARLVEELSRRPCIAKDGKSLIA